jgi:RNA polymerase sigma factor (sigma-70 family)
MSLSDESLLAGLGSGDPEVSAAFVRRFQGRVFGLAMTIVGEAGMAEEVAQEAFIRAWRHAGAFDPTRGRVVTWILAIARNAALDALRQRRHIPMDPASIPGWLSGPSDDPEERGVLADDARRLREAIALLPAEQRRAVLLAGFYGRTAREIGEIEGVPLGTAKTRIRTAMARLREGLEVTE